MMRSSPYLSFRSASRLAVLGVLIALTLFTRLPRAFADGATISTDQADYKPGDTVTYTGTGFQSGEVTTQLAKLSTTFYPVRNLVEQVAN